MATDFDAVAAALIAAAGANDETQGVIGWLSTGFLPLDYAISSDYDGGLPRGRIIEIMGPSSSGKTALATEVMISAQKAGGLAAFHDHERSFDVKLGVARGLDVSPGKWFFKTPKTFEDSVLLFIKAARAIRESKAFSKDAPLVWVFDSLASMIPQSQLAKDIDKQTMADQTALARATSLHFKVIASICEEYDVCVIFLNQMRETPGVVYGDPNKSSGGNAPKYYASVRILLGATRLMSGTGDEKVMIGSEITARCIKNKITRPWMMAKWRFMFNDDGTGKFDTIGSLVDTLVSKGLIEKAGAYLIWTNGKKYHRDVLVANLEKDAKASQALLEQMLKDNKFECDRDATGAALVDEEAEVSV